MCRKIRCDENSEKFCKFFLETKQGLGAWGAAVPPKHGQLCRSTMQFKLISTP